MFPHVHNVAVLQKNLAGEYNRTNNILVWAGNLANLHLRNIKTFFRVDIYICYLPDRRSGWGE